ncbi:MAG: type VI secretion system baseplate subunit TssG [Flavobacteriales bacterium]
MSAGNWEYWDGLLRSDGVDLRAEAVLAELLLTAAIGPDGFIQWPNGGFGRTSSTDIARMHPGGTVEWAGNKPVVEVNRLGLYDLLPEGLFHPVQRSRPFIGADDAVKEIRHNNAIEEAARTFFLPLDHELLRTRLQVELNERRLTAELLKDRTGKGVKGFWDPPKVFSGAELGRLLMILPQCHRITGDLVAMADAIGEILDLPVRIDHRYAHDHWDPPPDTPALDTLHLGVDTLLHGPMSTVERFLHVIIGPLDPDQANTFGQEQPGEAKVHKLMEYFAAGDQLWVLDIEVSPSASGSRLEEEGVSCRLGVSSILN